MAAEKKEKVKKIEENVLTKTETGHGRKTFKRFHTKCLQGMSEQLLVRLAKQNSSREMYSPFFFHFKIVLANQDRVDNLCSVASQSEAIIDM